MATESDGDDKFYFLNVQPGCLRKRTEQNRMMMTEILLYTQSRIRSFPVFF